VYKVGRAAPTKAASSATAAAQAYPVLEEQPKWVLLRQVAEEIQLQRGLIASLAGGATVVADAPEPKAPSRKRARTEPDFSSAEAQGIRGPSAPMSKSARGGAAPQGARAAAAHLPLNAPGSRKGGASPSVGRAREGQNGAAVIDLCDDSPSAGLQRDGSASDEAGAPHALLVRMRCHQD
jgi:hypothetical protein